MAEGRAEGSRELLMVALLVAVDAGEV